MLQILLSNLSIILLAYLFMNYVSDLELPQLLKKGIKILGFSAVIIFLFYNPIRVNHFLFDLRVVLLLFLSITQGWQISVPVLFITVFWRLTVIGGNPSLESVIYNMTIPVLIGLFFYKGEKRIYRYKTIFLLATSVWLVAFLPVIWTVSNGWNIFKRIAIVHYLVFSISFLVLYALFIFKIKHMEMEEKLHHMAFHDALTGIPNRYKLNDDLEQAIIRCSKNNQQLAILFLDLDRFKFINDTKGHSTGDLLLKQVVARLVENLQDNVILGRQGGDEFVLVIEDIDHLAVTKVAEQILGLFQEPFVIHNEEFYTSSSIGISIFPQDGEDRETLIKNADQAMYAAKKGGKNKFHFYTREQEDIFIRNSKIEHSLRRAIENNEFMLYYQPKIELQTGKIYGVEALLRWKHPTLGFISPAEFIPVAEETGIIVPIGRWVLKEACREVKVWQANGIFLKMAVNISTIHFEDRDFIEEIKEVLQDNQLSPEYIILEITESVMQNIKQNSAIFHELKTIGVSLAIDDFGTGYSSLSVLNNLPIDLVKIDQSFVNEIQTKTNTALMIKSIIKMGKDFNYHLVAEGIETKLQFEFLKQKGCHYGQGYYISKPLDAEGIKEFLNSHLQQV